MGAEINPSVCPTCGEPNQCGLSQGEAECWCFGMIIDPETLARIPSEKNNVACICARCAGAAKGETGKGSA